MRARISVRACAQMAGSGTRLISTRASPPESTESDLPPGFAGEGSRRAEGTGVLVALRAQVQMLSWVPMASPSSWICMLKLKSPSAVANSCPCGRPMHWTPACSGWTMRKVTSWIQYSVLSPG